MTAEAIGDGGGGAGEESSPYWLHWAVSSLCPLTTFWMDRHWKHACSPSCGRGEPGTYDASGLAQEPAPPTEVPLWCARA